MMIQWFLVWATLTLVHADYSCLCSYTVERPAYQTPDASARVIGYMYEFDCKPTANVKTAPAWTAIVMDRQVGYLKSDAKIQALTCQGSPNYGDTLPSTLQPPSTTAPPTSAFISTTRSTRPTTTAAVTTTTRKTTTTDTTTPTTTRKATTTTPTTPTPTTTKTTTTTPASTKRPFVKDDTSLCPSHAHNDVFRLHSILGQYGEFCYELIPQNASWNYSERHCQLRGGNLIRIANQGQQDYIYRFLQQHDVTEQVWIGLNDIAKEGDYVWSTGEPVPYTHYSVWHIFHLTHDIADCFVMQKNGEWDDITCGSDHFTRLPKSHGHPYICQYRVNSSLPSIVDFFKHLIG